MSQLVRKAQRGDKNAFITLMEEQKQTMYKVAVGILRNDTDAADAMQDTVLSCYENLQNLREPKYFQTWMFSIKEISSILKINENTIKTRLARGRGHFKKIYMKEHTVMNYRISEI